MNEYCTTCGNLLVANGSASGYGIDPDGNKHCYACSAKRELNAMREYGTAALYLTNKDGETKRWPRPQDYQIGDWTGLLKFDVVAIKEGRHNWAYGKRRMSVRFIDYGDPAGPTVWSGICYGHGEQFTRCSKTKIDPSNATVW